MTSSNQDNLIDLVEYFKEGLVNYSTGVSSGFDDDEYKRVRKVLMSAQSISNMLPEFIRRYRTLGEFWGYIKDESGTYAGRRQILGEMFNPIIDFLESSDSTLIMDYEDLGVIGSGGFGEVKRYKHKLLDMDFAFKFYSPIFANETDRNLERFFREAKILFKLSHPNIIKIYDVGVLNGKPFIRMELFQGKNLNQVIKDHGRFPVDKSLQLIIEIAEALKHAHLLGIVHRDIRPSNVMIAKPKQVRVIDFGLGIFLESEISSRLTRTGHNIAGGHYTAPELIQNPRLVDPRTDIYSLGALWFNSLTGQAPAGSNIRQTLFSRCSITEEIASILLRCLDDYNSRYRSIGELLSELEQIKNNLL